MAMPPPEAATVPELGTLVWPLLFAREFASTYSKNTHLSFCRLTWLPIWQTHTQWWVTFNFNYKSTSAFLFSQLFPFLILIFRFKHAEASRSISALYYQVQMYHGSGTVDRSVSRQLANVHQADTAYAVSRWQHFSAWKDVRHINLKNNPAKFHHDLIWKHKATGFFEECHPNKNNKTMSSDMG